MSKMQRTKISWSDFRWNPVHGCSKVSAGCDNCYAERISLNYKLTKAAWTNQNAAENVLLKPHKLREPYSIKEPSLVFVNSMSDMWHPQIPENYREQIFHIMRDLPQHIFQILTKRPRAASHYQGEWTENIWQGTSIENKATLHRINSLRDCGAKLLFLSIEPLLEDLGLLNLEGIHWVIVGGESGPNHRPMPHKWARSIRDQCIEEGIPFFFKQSSAYKNETGKLLEEIDGTQTKWEQMPKKIL